MRPRGSTNATDQSSYRNNGTLALVSRVRRSLFSRPIRWPILPPA